MCSNLKDLLFFDFFGFYFESSLYEQFVSKRKSIERCHKNQENLQLKLRELNAEELDLNNKLKLVIGKTKELQKYVRVHNF